MKWNIIIRALYPNKSDTLITNVYAATFKRELDVVKKCHIHVLHSYTTVLLMLGEVKQ